MKTIIIKCNEIEFKRLQAARLKLTAKNNKYYSWREFILYYVGEKNDQRK